MYLYYICRCISYVCRYIYRYIYVDTYLHDTYHIYLYVTSVIKEVELYEYRVREKSSVVCLRS